MSTTSTFAVSGMTCGHCVNAVTAELSKLPGVRDVTVDLVAERTSSVHVTTDAPLDESAVRMAIDEAGYELVPATS